MAHINAAAQNELQNRLRNMARSPKKTDWSEGRKMKYDPLRPQKPATSLDWPIGTKNATSFTVLCKERGKARRKTPTSHWTPAGKTQLSRRSPRSPSPRPSAMKAFDSPSATPKTNSRKKQSIQI
jgi:hypothetical protein